MRYELSKWYLCCWSLIPDCRAVFVLYYVLNQHKHRLWHHKVLCRMRYLLWIHIYKMHHNVALTYPDWCGYFASRITTPTKKLHSHHINIKKMHYALGDELKKSVHNTIVTAIQNDQPSDVPSRTNLRGAFSQLWSLLTHTSYDVSQRVSVLWHYFRAKKTLRYHALSGDTKH